MKNFVIIGAGGYIAPRHMKAIKDTGNNLLAAIDVNDAVGILDNYFINTLFFRDLGLFEDYVNEVKSKGTKIDYIVVCTPNYLHEEHIRFGLRIGADVICEKPAVIDPEAIERLQKAEQETNRKVSTILQLRWHPALVALKERITNSTAKNHSVQLQYITSRGNWYQKSWKGNTEKSGGIATNIGIHFFDMLQWIFGTVIENKVNRLSTTGAAGQMQLSKALVNWSLSIDENELPASLKAVGKKAYRMLKIDDEIIEFSEGLADLHTKSYEEILQGNGFALVETLPSIQIVHDIKNTVI